MMKKLLLLCTFLGATYPCLAEEMPNLSLAKNFHYACSEALVPIPEKTETANKGKELSKVVNLYSCLYYLRGLSENTYVMQSFLKKSENDLLSGLCLPSSGLNDYDALHMFLAYLGKQTLTSEDTTRTHFFVALTEKYRCQK